MSQRETQKAKVGFLKGKAVNSYHFNVDTEHNCKSEDKVMANPDG